MRGDERRDGGPVLARQVGEPANELCRPGQNQLASWQEADGGGRGSSLIVFPVLYPRIRSTFKPFEFEQRQTSTQTSHQIKPITRGSSPVNVTFDFPY